MEADFTDRTKIGHLNLVQSKRVESLMTHFGLTENPRHFLNLLIEDLYKLTFHNEPKLLLLKGEKDAYQIER